MWIPTQQYQFEKMLFSLITQWSIIFGSWAPLLGSPQGKCQVRRYLQSQVYFLTKAAHGSVHISSDRHSIQSHLHSVPSCQKLSNLNIFNTRDYGKSSQTKFVLRVLKISVNVFPGKEQCAWANIHLPNVIVNVQNTNRNDCKWVSAVWLAPDDVRQARKDTYTSHAMAFLCLHTRPSERTKAGNVHCSVSIQVWPLQIMRLIDELRPEGPSLWYKAMSLWECGDQGSLSASSFSELF